MTTLRIEHKLIRELMESDPEFTIEVKQAILKTAIRGEAFVMFDESIKGFVRDEAKEAAASYSVNIKKEVELYGDSTWNDWKPSELMKKRVTELVASEFNSMIRSHITASREDLIKKLSVTEKDIMSYVDRKVKHDIELQINNEVVRRINAVINGLGAGLLNL